MMTWIALATVGGIALTGGIIAAVRRSRQRALERMAAMQQVAAGLNLSYTERDDALPKELVHFPLFSKGHGRKGLHVMRGRSDELQITLFDYQYVVQAGNHTQVWKQTVALFETRHPALPTFSMRPEHVFHRLGRLFGYQDINFDTHPGFSRKYLLRGEREDQIRSAFTPRVLDHFEHRPGLCIEAAGGQLIYCRPGKTANPEGIEAFLRDAVMVYSLFTA